MAQFKPGDVVKLKSGGPAMTVVETETDGEVICEWFDKKERKSGAFKEAVLHTVDPNAGWGGV